MAATHTVCGMRHDPFTPCPTPTGDDLALAVHAGAADARHGRARKVDIPDTSPVGAAYHRGYDQPQVNDWRYES